jgi:hypothetical protein
MVIASISIWEVPAAPSSPSDVYERLSEVSEPPIGRQGSHWASHKHEPLPIRPGRHHAKPASLPRCPRTRHERLSLALGSRGQRYTHESRLPLLRFERAIGSSSTTVGWVLAFHGASICSGGSLSTTQEPRGSGPCPLPLLVLIDMTWDQGSRKIHRPLSRSLPSM